jgi:hypothetical protein
MSDAALTVDQMEQISAKRRERRDFFRSLLTPMAAAGAVTTVFAPTGASAQAADPSDADILNFALNLEYLEAQFYTYAVTGNGLPPDLLTGTGTRGDVIGGRQVPFSDPVVAAYAREIQQDEVAHVRFIRRALGSAAVAQPAIDVGTAPNGAFSTAARAAGLIGPGQSFDAYANDENFLLGAFIFEDVGVTAYKGAAPLVDSPVFLEAAAGILAVEAYHAALVRTVLYRKGIQTPALIDATEAISNARDSLDGTTDLDQGIRPIGQESNIVPLDADGLVFSRTTGQVLNIAYLNAQAVSQGGFFPAGVNGNIKTSAAN